MRLRPCVIRLGLGAFVFLLTGLPAVCQRLLISGRVIYEHDFSPANMVTVALRNFTDMGMEQTNTSSLGEFTFSVPRGVYYLNIRIPGYAEVNERVEVGVFSTQGITLYLKPLPGKGPAIKPASSVPAEYLKIPEKAREEYETGMKLFQREGKLDQGLLHLRKAVELHPEFALAHLGMGMLHMDLDRLDEARDSFAKAISENEKLLPAYFPLGAIYNQQRQFAEAEKILRKAIEVKEDIWQLHFELARAVAYQARWEEAEKSALRAAELNETAPNVHLLLANIYFEVQKDNLALAAAEEFLRLAPNDPLAPEIRRRVEAMRGAAVPPVKPPPQ